MHLFTTENSSEPVGSAVSGSSDIFLPDSGNHDSMGNIIIPETQMSDISNPEGEGKRAEGPIIITNDGQDLQFIGFADEDSDLVDIFPSTDEINSILRRSKKRKVNGNASSFLQQVENNSPNIC